MPVPEPLRPPDTSIEPGRPVERFAARTAGMTASEIRALFAVASRPEVVSLAGGMPNLAALPLDALAGEVAELVARDGQVALQYGSAQGVPALREQICEVMALEGIRADPTTSSSPSARRWRWTSSPGSSATPATSCSPRGRPTSARSAASPRTRRGSCTSRWTRTAWCRELLRDALRTLRGPGVVPKFLYTIPNFHNPAGVTLAVERRRRGARRSAAEYGVAVLEDNPYGLLGFTGQTYPALRSMDRDVVYLGSFSKTFASGPAGRLGAGAARRARPAGAGRRVGDPVPAEFHPDAGLALPGGARLARPGQDLHRGLPRPPRRDARARWRPTCPTVPRGTSRTAASTCG